MKRYTLSFAEATQHIPDHPDRTAYRSGEWDYMYQVWPSREAMLKTIELQQKKASNKLQWRDWKTSNLGRRILASTVEIV